MRRSLCSSIKCVQPFLTTFTSEWGEPVKAIRWTCSSCHGNSPLFSTEGMRRVCSQAFSLNKLKISVSYLSFYNSAVWLLYAMLSGDDATLGFWSCICEKCLPSTVSARGCWDKGSVQTAIILHLPPSGVCFVNCALWTTSLRRAPADNCFIFAAHSYESLLISLQTGDPSPTPVRQAWQTLGSQTSIGPQTAKRTVRTATPPTALPTERTVITAGRLHIQVGTHTVFLRVWVWHRLVCG